VALGNPGYPIRQSGAALIELDQAAERRQPFEKARVGKIFPSRLNVGDEAWDDQEVSRAVADHLIGDAHIAALREFGFGSHRLCARLTGRPSYRTAGLPSRAAAPRPRAIAYARRTLSRWRERA